MANTLFELIEKNVDGCGTDVTTIFECNSSIKELEEGDLSLLKTHLEEFKEENYMDYESFDIILETLSYMERLGYELSVKNPSYSVEI